MPACNHFDALCAERASGSLDATDTLWLDAHLANCERCRTALAEYAQLFGLARLPPTSDEEHEVLGRLPARVRVGLREAEDRWSGWRPLALSVAAAAALVFVVRPISLSVLERKPAETVEAAAWVEPDPDALFERVELENAELAIASEDELARAELIADHAYYRAVEDE